MCIIVYKEAGAQPLKRKIYKRCFDKNDDGAGFAWWDAEEQLWNVHKGLMTFKKFWRAFNSHQFGEMDTVISHFRIGTSGNRKGPDCTHPFPITFDFEEMRELEYQADNIVFHNGVIGFGKEKNSDTMMGVAEYVAPLFPHIEEKGITEILGEVLEDTKCRWLITKGDQPYLYGNWLEDADYGGYFFSNDGYKEPKVYVQPESGNSVYESRYGNFNRTHSFEPPTTIRFYRFESGITASQFIGSDGLWVWPLWNEALRLDRIESAKENNAAIFKSGSDASTDSKLADGIVDALTGDTPTSIIVTPHDKKHSYEDFPVSVTGLLDNKGNVIWQDGYQEEDDMACCPGCGEDNAMEASQLLHGDTVCVACGCVFVLATGQILLYDPSVIADDGMLRYQDCPYCDTVVTVDEWGQCPKCSEIIDPTIAENRIKLQRAGAKCK